MLEAVGLALARFGSLDIWFFIIVGILVGIIIGIVPGVGNMTSLPLILPFAFLMSPWQVLPLMTAMMSVSFAAGSITACLLGVPGDEPNVATIIDGFPMSKKGEAGRAVGAALAASGMGSIFAAVMALAMIPLILPMVLALRTADMVFIILLGLSFIAVMGTGSMTKGLISGGLGLLLSFVGLGVGTGEPRFTFGSIYLFDGISFVPAALGLFGVPEMVHLSAGGGAIAETGLTITGLQDVLRGVKDTFRHWWLTLRCSILGYIIGIIPGIGSMTAIFVAYGHAKKGSKHPETFGTGEVEGVIAPQGAMCACRAGDVLVTLALGIPGGAVMGVFIGAMLLVGVFPGPEMLSKNLDLSLHLMFVIIVSGIIASIICLVAAAPLSKIAFIPGRILVPLVIVLLFIGTYARERIFADLITLLIFSVLGLAMRKFDYSRAGLLVGLILGLPFEQDLFIALDVAGPLFFLRPISLAIIVINIGLFAYGPIKNTIQDWLKGKAAKA